MASLPKSDFQFLPIPHTPANPRNLTLTRSSTWTYCGPLLSLPENNNNDTTPPSYLSYLPPSFHTWSTQTFTSPPSHLLQHLLPLLRATHTFLLQHGIHHYWLTIRASQPTPDFDTPRWHTDDNFFTDPAQNDFAKGIWKLCATLQGQGTVFAADGDKARKLLRKAKERARKQQKEHECTTVRCVACGRTSEVVREEVRVGMEREGVRVVQPGIGEMVFFRVGGREGAVHSEPRIGCDRVFVNVVPGTEEELRGLMGRWGMEFPRSWSLGVPFMLMMDGVGLGGGGGGEDREKGVMT